MYLIAADRLLLLNNEAVDKNNIQEIKSQLVRLLPPYNDFGEQLLEVFLQTLPDVILDDVKFRRKITFNGEIINNHKKSRCMPHLSCKFRLLLLEGKVQRQKTALFRATIYHERIIFLKIVNPILPVAEKILTVKNLYRYFVFCLRAMFHITVFDWSELILSRINFDRSIFFFFSGRELRRPTDLLPYLAFEIILARINFCPIERRLSLVHILDFIKFLLIGHRYI